MEYASQFDEFSDSFQDPDARQKQLDAFMANPFDKTAEFFFHNSGLLTGADVIAAYVKGDREHYVESVKSGHWYQNMASKIKPALSKQIQAAEDKAVEQTSFFTDAQRKWNHWNTSR